MDIQSIFYFLASIFMILGIVVMISILSFLWYLKNSAEEIKIQVSEKISTFVQAQKLAGLIPLVGMAIKWARDRKAKED